MRAREFIQEDRLDENPLILGLLSALATGIRVAAPYVGRGLWGATKMAARNPIKTGVGSVAATHPEQTGKAIDATMDAYDLAKQAYNVISDPKAAAEVAAKKVWSSAEEAATDIASIVGDNLNSQGIEKLANAAIEYALPVAAVIAILYGGKMLYDYMHSSSNAQPQAA